MRNFTRILTPADLALACAAFLSLPVMDYYVVYFISQICGRRAHAFAELLDRLRPEAHGIKETWNVAIYAFRERHEGSTNSEIPMEEKKALFLARQPWEVMKRQVKLLQQQHKHLIAKNKECLKLVLRAIHEHNQTAKIKIHMELVRRTREPPKA
ncbi:hypothetical protein MMC14_001201 [Varicellaria rhodocarpa]|nr:hypothetical protein [Varicellaria rhodocarpa]